MWNVDICTKTPAERSGICSINSTCALDDNTGGAALIVICYDFAGQIELHCFPHLARLTTMRETDTMCRCFLIRFACLHMIILLCSCLYNQMLKLFSPHSPSCFKTSIKCLYMLQVTVLLESPLNSDPSCRLKQIHPPEIFHVCSAAFRFLPSQSWGDLLQRSNHTCHHHNSH